MPRQLHRATPRGVRLNAAGVAVALLSGALAIAGLWGGVELFRRALYTPSGQPLWPAFAVPAAALMGTALLVSVFQRQINLLSYGRPAGAIVTKVEKKPDRTTYWLVEYEWKVLSGATRRGHYKHTRKRPPAVGAAIPIVYDRDEPLRHMRYPLPLVRLI